jgi:hypothetical protein
VKPDVREGRPSDAELLVGRLRDFDIEEMEAFGHHSPDELLIESWEITKQRWTIWVGDEVATVFGCRTLKTDVGIPWLLGSDLTPIRTLLSRTGEYIEKMLKNHRFLYNFVYHKNRKSINWLERSGFTFKDPEPYGEFGNLFRMFYRVR